MRETDDIRKVIIKYLEKHKICRFNDIYKLLNTAFKDPPAKSTVSTILDDMANEGIIFSWHKKGARFISLKVDVDQVKDDILKLMKDKWLEKDKFTFQEIENELVYPYDILNDALTGLLAQGKIVNNVIDGVTYYKLPPIHQSIKFGLTLALSFAILYFFGNKFISKDHLFIVAFAFMCVITFLWYCIR